MSEAPAQAQGTGRIRRTLDRLVDIIALPVVAIALALIVGAVVILASELIISGRPFDPTLPLQAYRALVEGAIGSPEAIVNTLVASTPLVLGGLAVGFGFKAGLFNIGAQGQFLMGALGSVAVGVMVATWPPLLAIPVATLAGFLAGCLYGFIPGFLKAARGAHEVVTTIMLNYVAMAILAYAVSGPLKVPGSPSPITHDVGNAAYPIIIGETGHLGILVALAAVGLIWALLYRTTRGFEVRTVGANPDAARYAGMRPRYLIMYTMTLSGGLAGLAGTSVVLGVSHSMTSSFGTTVGFDSIAVALLARSSPVGIIFSALLFGAMRAGASLMQIQAGIPAELVDVLQATILLFLIATPALLKMTRLRSVRGGLETTTITRSYGGEAVAR